MNLGEKAFFEKTRELVTFLEVHKRIPEVDLNGKSLIVYFRKNFFSKMVRVEFFLDNVTEDAVLWLDVWPFEYETENSLQKVNKKKGHFNFAMFVQSIFTLALERKQMKQFIDSTISGDNNSLIWIIHPN